MVKRRTREAYRLQKAELLYAALKNRDELLLLSLQYVGKQIYDYAFFEKKLAIAFKKLTVQFGTDENN